MDRARWFGHGGFFAAAGAGDPVATWIGQSMPLVFLIPTSLWSASRTDDVVPALATWLVGASVFNLLWIPYLRRNEHPPPGSSQSVASATSTAAVFYGPDLWLLLSCFILMGLTLGFTSGGRKHPAFQFACLMTAGAFAFRAGAVSIEDWLIFTVFIAPMIVGAVSFVAAELAHQEQQLDSTLTASGASAWDLTTDGVVHASVGVTIPGVEVGTDLQDLLHPDDERPIAPEPGSILEYRIVDPAGGWRWIRENVEVTQSASDYQRSGAMDITAEKQQIEADRRRVNIDQLTAGPSRVSHIREADTRAERGSGYLVLIDLDDFKQINDTLGHSVGDRVLHTVAARLGGFMEGAHVARLGGDEFASLLEVRPDEVQRVAEAMITSITRPFSVDSMIVYTGASAGVAPFEIDLGADEVRRRAGVALRAAKATGGVAVRYNTELEYNSARRKDLATRLPLALANGEMTMLHQPKIDLATGRLVGFEALVRWQHSEEGLLAPIEFLDLVAVGGHHRALLPIVLERALADLTVIKSTDPDLTVSVNVDARNLREPDLADHLLDAVNQHGLSPDDLVVELTEDALIGEDQTVLKTLQQLTEAGVELSVDDFGSGFSSLAYLTKLPVSEVKLDRSLVTGISTDGRTRAVAESVLQLANRLNLRVVAEGIEDASTLDYLADQGCSVGQGYHIGRPQPIQHWLEQAAGDRVEPLQVQSAHP